MKKFIDKFKEFYGTAPTAAAQAPGRLEILGNHTDYNGGLTLSCAVAQTTKCAVKPIDGTICRVKDFRNGMDVTFDLSATNAEPPRDGSKYIKGTVLELQKRGLAIGAFLCAIESEVPLSAGMSSSAALEVATALALCQAYGEFLPKAELARACQGVENNYLGLKTGLLDQFSSLFGEANALIMSDFRTVEVVRTCSVPSGYAIVVINSMKKHNLVDSEYNARRADCESAAAKLGVKQLRDVSGEMLEANRDKLTDREYRRAAHIVGEDERVIRAAELLDKGDITGFGQLLFQSHESSRVNFENSSPELNYLVELAHSVPGCLGARLSGGGFGGISIHLVKAEDAQEYAERVSAAFKLRSGVAADYIICAIGNGASIYEF